LRGPGGGVEARATLPGWSTFLARTIRNAIVRFSTRIRRRGPRSPALPPPSHLPWTQSGRVTIWTRSVWMARRSANRRRLPDAHGNHLGTGRAARRDSDAALIRAP